ncbi:MAG: hypothetical protein R6X10_07050 [Desulfobacterales bacterium]
MIKKNDNSVVKTVEAAGLGKWKNYDVTGFHGLETGLPLLIGAAVFFTKIIG